MIVYEKFSSMTTKHKVNKTQQKLHQICVDKNCFESNKSNKKMMQQKKLHQICVDSCFEKNKSKKKMMKHKQH